MDLVEIIFLALIQGLTEFLPISSSAHLILPSQLLGWADQGLAFDVAVHVGTLTAVVTYFRRDIVELVVAWFASFGDSGPSPESRLGWYLIVGTIPAGLAGLFFDQLIEMHLRSVVVIAATTILFGLLLGFADRVSNRSKAIDRLRWQDALLIGVAQALALIPGTSRSGITMTAALLLGFNRQAAARFSFLLSIPIIVLSGAFKLLQMMQQTQVDWFAVTTGTLISAIAAFSCIHLFLKWIDRIGMMPFVVYRLLLGATLIIFIYSA